jgi:charged multivesicular body protein 7
MSWGARQLKGMVVGSDDSAPKIRIQELVLVENLQVGGDLFIAKCYLLILLFRW